MSEELFRKNKQMLSKSFRKPFIFSFVCKIIAPLCQSMAHLQKIAPPYSKILCNSYK